MKYLEYEILSGRILSELTASQPPHVAEGIGLLEIGEDVLSIDTTGYAVRNGRLVKTSETDKERLERERIQRERQAKLRVRLNSMCREVCIAILAEDKEELSNLRREYRRMVNVL